MHKSFLINYLFVLGPLQFLSRQGCQVAFIQWFKIQCVFDSQYIKVDSIEQQMHLIFFRQYQLCDDIYKTCIASMQVCIHRSLNDYGNGYKCDASIQSTRKGY